MNMTALNLDERTFAVIRKISTRFHFLTMVVLGVVLIYRQFILGMPVEGVLQDIANVFTANVVLWLAVAFYFGGIYLGRVRLLSVISVYAGLFVIGTIFTAVKYSATSFQTLYPHMMVVAGVSACLVAFWAVFAYLGQRRVERELAE